MSNTDVMSAVRPRDESSQAYSEALDKIDAELQRIEGEQAALKGELSEMLIDGTPTDIRTAEKALDDLDLDRRRLEAAEPIMRSRYAQAVARESEVARRDKGEVAAEAIEKFNSAFAGGSYERAAKQIADLIAMERAARAALAAYHAAPRARLADGVVHSAPPAMPELARVPSGNTTRSLESLVRLPSLKPGQPPFAFWVDPSTPRGEAAAYSY